jgi:P4 family phage/plasmid primase-like protien
MLDTSYHNNQNYPIFLHGTQYRPDGQQLNFVSSVYDTTAPATVSLDTVVEEIRAGVYTKAINTKAKQDLPAWAFNGLFSGTVTNDGFAESTGLFHFDVDNLGDSLEMTRYTLMTLVSLVLLFKSTGGNGLKGCLRIDPARVQSDADFKQVFGYMQRQLADLGVTIDPSCSDVRRLCFVSSDPDVYYAPDAPAMTVPAPPPAPPRALQPIQDLPGVLIDLQSALAAVPSDDRDVWVKVGQALKTLPDDAGWAIYDEWSKTSTKYDARDCARVWRGFKPSKTSYKAVFDIAAAHGWQNPGRRVDTTAVFGGAGNGGFMALTGDVRDGTAATQPLTELGNAHRLFMAHGAYLRYINDVGAWLHWNAGCWSWDTDAAKIRALAHKLPGQIYNEGGQFIQHAEAFAKWSRSSQSAKTVSNAISMLSDIAEIRVPISNLDANDWLIGINDARWAVDLNTGQVRPATQFDYITKSLAVDRVGNASQASRWLAFLDQIFEGDRELIDWVQRWCGYLLTGDTSEHCFVFCYGHGANGKSVFADTLRYVMGDYARAISTETLTETRRAAGNATPDLADLAGARLAMSSETEDGAGLAESLVKSLVAGDTISVRRLYSAPTQVTPKLKLMMLGNHKPIIHGNDDGIWRRIRLLPFNRTFDKHERDLYLTSKLRAEAEHILAWMIDGCLAWRSIGLGNTPAVIENATVDYRSEQDVFGSWLNERCKLGRAEEANNSLLYSNYQHWCVTNGLKPSSSVAFGRRLAERGFHRRKTNGVVIWNGVSLGFG